MKQKLIQFVQIEHWNDSVVNKDLICSHVSSLEKALALLGASLPNRDKMNHLITRLRYVNTIIARYLKATCTHVIFYQRNWTVLSVIRLTNFLKCVAKNLRTKAW